MAESESGGGVKARRNVRGAIVEWQLHYSELSDAEALALEQFYVARGGGLEAFTFVDPMANALLQSERPDASAWHAMGVSPTPSAPEWNGHKVFSMEEGGWLSQDIEVAGGITYCASAWVKGPVGGRFRVDLAGNPMEIELNGCWQRCWSTMAAAPTDGVVPVSFENTGAQGVDLAGMCVEGQPYPGESRKSGVGKSLYREARFDEGGFRSIPAGPDRNTVQVTIRAAIEEQA